MGGGVDGVDAEFFLALVGVEGGEVVEGLGSAGRGLFGGPFVGPGEFHFCFFVFLGVGDPFLFDFRLWNHKIKSQ